MKFYFGLMDFGEIFDEKFHDSLPLYLIYFSLSFRANLKIKTAYFFKTSRTN